MDNKGQLYIEYIFLFIIVIMIILISVQLISEENELNIALNCAKSGAYEGTLVDSISIYSIKEYNSLYSNRHLFNPKRIKILKIDYYKSNYNSSFKKINIEIKVTATSDFNLSNTEKSTLSQIINNRIRRSIVYGFHNEDKTDAPYYNICYSNRFVYRTEDVNWV
ncbi:hypothetical protein BGI41_06395 [Methanobrevibacter sp. 87.7]|uniref:hypothetical protein n=1 Tax=Methanobrevibacter sp. 87.7 TaxID=387957 RepID=UPI000B513734|nr:hypothetical protein [Methanobrevibacter sp. 87.7]OWT32686.1 hypothetical protein BGI41_06395 [Methanobrevibacter sp. 87.7]